MRSGKIAEIVKGRLVGPADITVVVLVVDSRKATMLSSSSLFVALRGKRNDGHQFIDSVYRRGVRSFIVEEGTFQDAEHKYPDAAFIYTDNTLDSLHKIAVWKRTNYNGIVIGVTGSNGKTIVKEWIAETVGKEKTVVRSPRSYNSQTGVPLSVWQLDNRYEIAVLEAGMSMPGEIAKLEKIIKPNIGIFTNIGEAHQENFRDIESKVAEKLNLFSEAGTIIYSADHHEVHNSIKKDKRFNNRNLVTWSVNNSDADVRVSIIRDSLELTELNVEWKGDSFTVKLPFTDQASIENGTTVITLLLQLGIDSSVISREMELLTPVAMRMELKDGINNCSLIEDFYNSDPGSFAIAIDYLKSLPGKNRRVIISDFIQTARDRADLYGEVAALLERSNVKNIIGVGHELSASAGLFPPDTLFFETTEELVEWFKPGYFSNEVILLKGARIFEFEKIGRLLELKAHITTLEVDLNKLLNNLNLFREHMPDQVKIMAMVKAFAYGVGYREISDWLVYNGIDFLAVAYADEGINLRKAGTDVRIMVMNPDITSFESIIAYDLEPEIYCRTHLEGFILEAEREGLTDYPVHIKLDTGMHRLGFMEDEIDYLTGRLCRTTSVKVASVFSHLAAAEDAESDNKTLEQVKLFEKMSLMIGHRIGEGFLRHLLNSAGIARFPEYSYDMVRLGIGLYGVAPVQLAGISQVVRFRSKVSQVKKIIPGEGVSYGFTDRSEEARTIAIIPVGYADGLSRKLSNGRGNLFVDGRPAPIVGHICMDMCMIDVTGMDVKPGDEIEIFGNNISLSEVARQCETIPYEILTGIPPRVKRIYIVD